MELGRAKCQKKITIPSRIVTAGHIMKMTNMSEDEILGRIKMGVNVDIKRSDGKPKRIFYFKIVYSMKIEPIIDECHFCS